MTGLKNSRIWPTAGHLLGMALLAAVVAGCSRGQSLRTLGMLPEEAREICSVAIFPFFDQSKFPQGGLIAYRVFSSELAAAGLFDVMLEGEVRTFFRENRELPGTFVNRDFYVKMGRTMGVDAVILGTVVNMAEGSEGKETVVPEVSLSVELIHIKEGRPIIASYHSRSGNDFRKVMHIGIMQTIPGLLSHMSKEVINEWKQAGVKGCSG